MKIYSIILAWLISLVIVGCFANIPLTHYYTFQPGKGNLVKTANPKHPYVLGVELYDADVPYQQDKIVFRTSAYEVNFYEYHRWLRPPTELVTEQAISLLAASRLFQKVHGYAFEAYSDYILRGRIVMFDQWYTGKASSSVHVGILYQMLATEQERTVWTESIETTAEVSGVEIVETVKAFETALQENILQAIAEIEQVVATEP